MLAFAGVIFILAGLVTLGVATTMFGQIAGLVLWVIATLFIVGQAVVGAIEREARGLGKALAMHARATAEPPRIGGVDSQPSRPVSTPPKPAASKSSWKRFLDYMNRH